MLVVGTATDIGKTWVGGRTLSIPRGDGLSVAARKSAQSADPTDTGPSDAEVLADATGEAVTDVCPPHRTGRAVAMASPMAADALDLPVPTLAEPVAELLADATARHHWWRPSAAPGHRSATTVRRRPVPGARPRHRPAGGRRRPRHRQRCW